MVEQTEVRDSLKSVWCKGGKDACKSGTDNGEIPRQHYSAKAVRRRAREARVVERHVHERRKGVIAAKVRTMEERAEERDSWTAAWCKGDKDAHRGGTDNGEIRRWPSGAKVARSRAREVWAVERQIHERRNGVIVAKVRTVEEHADERDSLTAVLCKDDKDAHKGGTDKGKDFLTVVRCNGGKEWRKGVMGSRETDSSTRNGVIVAKVQNGRGTGGRDRFIDGGMVLGAAKD